MGYNCFMEYKRYYVKNAMVFLTIVTAKRCPFLLNHVELIKKSLYTAKFKFKFEIFALVILPEHIHLIIKSSIQDDYPGIVKAFKSYFSRNFDVKNISNYVLPPSKAKKGEKNIWQSRYWAHVILDENDLYKHLDYVHYNPIKHGHVDKAKDWKYSTFHKFVKLGYYEDNWCNFDNSNKIDALDFE